MPRLTPRRLLILAVVAALAACATPLPPPAPAPVVPPKAEPVPIPPPPPRKVEKKRAKPLNVASECKFRNETGYNGNARMRVADSQVGHFEARVNVPKRGTCDFAMKDFKQVKHEPHVELASAKGCTIRMWEQGRQFTVAFADCNRHCSGNAADYLWPILVDKPTGRCN